MQRKREEKKRKMEDELAVSNTNFIFILTLGPLIP